MKRASLIAMTLLAALSAQHGAWAVDYPRNRMKSTCLF
jgi:L,D-transpeptidase YnhG